MDNILISLEEVAQFAQAIHQTNVQIADCFARAKETMSSLAIHWESPGAAEIRSRFESFSLRFDQEYQAIEEYVRFLNHTVESYDALESTIHANANNF